MKKTISKLRIIVGIATIILGSLLVSAIVHAHTEAEEAQLRTIQQETDRNATTQSDQSHVQALAQQFQVPESEIERLRSEGQGWGEIKIELAMARQLAQENPNTYPTFSDALSRVEHERGLGKGWGQISNDLGFKLGPVIREAQHEGKEIRMDMKENARDSRDAMKELQKESKKNAKENKEAVKDTLKGLKGVGEKKKKK